MGAQILNLSLPVLQKALFQGSPSASRGLVESGRSFGSVLAGTLETKGSKKTDLGSIGNDVLALLQSGTPLSLVVNQMSQTLANKVAAALSSGAQHSIDAISKNKLVQAFASALAPPGGSPPGSNAEIAATLAERLQTLVANLAGGTQANVGQQNRFSGPVLDANSAKEIPAQQQSGQPASVDAAVSSFVDSILKDVLAQLAPASASPSAPAPPIAVAPLLTPHLTAPNPDLKAPLLTPADSKPGDILGRIIARAVMTDARLNAGNSQAASGANAIAAAKTAPAQTQPQVQTAPADVRAALDNLIAAVTDASKNASGGNGGNAFAQNGNAFGGAFGQQVLAQLTDSKPFAASPADGNSFPTQANALLGTWNLPAPGSQPVANLTQPLLTPYTTLDANSIIDQVVKGFVVRSFGENQSEVRMRLSPEHLGDVSLKLSVAGGTISASITAQNADVRETLLANQSQLSKSLSDAGLKLANFSVNVSGGGANGSSQQQQLAHHAGVRRVGLHGIGRADDDADGQDDVLAATPNFGPPLLVGRNPGLFNYLA